MEKVKQITQIIRVEKMMLERKGTERKNQPGYLLIQLSYICTNLENGMEKSVIGVDLKQEANAKVGIDPIRLVNSRAPIATLKSKG